MATSSAVRCQQIGHRTAEASGARGSPRGPVRPGDRYDRELPPCGRPWTLRQPGDSPPTWPAVSRRARLLLPAPGAPAWPPSRPTAGCSTPGTPRPRWSPAPTSPGPPPRPLAAGAPGRSRLDAGSRRRAAGRRRGRRRAGPTSAGGVERVAVATFVERLDDPPVDAHDVYLRLHLLSHRLVAPQRRQPRRHLRPAQQRRVDQRRALRGRRLRADPAWRCGPPGRHVQVFGVDKFPRMTDYVVPAGVRIADADRVRLGAHLASGTTVMHEGFVNFNAGTLGTVDGRGPDQPGRRGRRGLRRRRRRVDHGHAVGRRQGGHPGRRALPDRRQRRHRHLARRRLRGRGRPLRHRRHPGHPARRHGRQGASSSAAATACCSAATAPPAPSRCCPGPARTVELNAALHSND